MAPAATLVTLTSAGGTWLCKSLLFPQAITVPTAACETFAAHKRMSATVVWRHECFLRHASVFAPSCIRRGTDKVELRRLRNRWESSGATFIELSNGFRTETDRRADGSAFGLPTVLIRL